jgi:hypothetical protein
VEHSFINDYLPLLRYVYGHALKLKNFTPKEEDWSKFQKTLNNLNYTEMEGHAANKQRGLSR